MKLHRWFFIASLCWTLSGCVPAISPNQNPGSGAQARSGNSGNLGARTQLFELKEELQKLRNAVEEIQFDTENVTRRQHNLFEDLDRRLLSLERAQRLLNPQAPAGDNLGATPGVANNGLTGVGETAIGAVAGAPPLNGQGAGGTTQTNATTGATADTTNGAPSAQAKTVSLSEQKAYDRAFSLLKQSKYQAAIKQFRKLASTWPDSPLADDAYYWQSEAHYVNRETEAALSGFQAMLARYPNSERVPEALLKIGYIRYDIGSYQEAARIFRDILARFPTHQVAVSAQIRLRRIEQTIQ